MICEQIFDSQLDIPIFDIGDTPWVGVKESGYGYHGSPDGYRRFAQPKVISRMKGARR